MSKQMLATGWGTASSPLCVGSISSLSQHHQHHRHRAVVSPVAPASRRSHRAIGKPSSPTTPLLLIPPSASKGTEPIQGYTPANYISYSDREEHTVRHLVGVSVQAPVSVCFELWNDWARLVDFLDLISQIGLDPDEPDMALLQCFYRWGRMPVMEIVFLARKLHVEQDKLIQFETVWGLPAKGEVEFLQDGPNNTTVMFRFEHKMPVLLVELKVDALGMETHMKSILAENMEDFKQLAEMLAQDPDRAPPKRMTEHMKAVGGSGAPPATQPQETMPWAQREQGEASSSSSETASEGKPKSRGRSKSRASPVPSSVLQQQEGGESGEGVQPKKRGRPRSKSAATPGPTDGSESGSGTGSVQEGSSSNGVGRRKSATRSVSPTAAAVMGEQKDGAPVPPPVSSKGRRSKSVTSPQQ